MSETKLATKADLKEMYDRILPYMGGMPEMLANKFSKGDLYSTDEKMIGQWIDGKPLYAKTMTTTITAKDTNVYFDDTPTNIDKIVDLVGRIYISDSDQIILNKYMEGTDYISFIASKVFVRVIADNRINKPAVGTVIYTKTTDSAISIGSDTDYSTTEKIVGTWIDGKPIYQRTYIGTTQDGAMDTTITTVSELNLDTLVCAHGILNAWSGYIEQIPRGYADSTVYADISIKPSGNIDLMLNTYYVNGHTNDYTMTLQYTKTTS